MFEPQHAGQEDPRVAGIDEVSTLVILKLRTTSRAGSKDRPRYRQEVRELLQDYVNKRMAFADALDH
jgi:hypothetical protein